MKRIKSIKTLTSDFHLDVSYTRKKNKKHKKHKNTKRQTSEQK